MSEPYFKERIFSRFILAFAFPVFINITVVSAG
jgi:hypothetical protein